MTTVMKDQEKKVLIKLLKQFEKETRLKEVGLFENATVAETIRIIKRIYKMEW